MVDEGENTIGLQFLMAGGTDHSLHTPVWFDQYSLDYDIRRADKAKEFLKSWLTDDEYKELQNDGLVIPSKLYSGRTYKVKKIGSMMVEVYSNGKIDHKLCAVDKKARYENDDTVLAKILMLKSNEKQFLEIAERHELCSNLHVTISSPEWIYLNESINEQLTLAWSIGGDIVISDISQPSEAVRVAGTF